MKILKIESGKGLFFCSEVSEWKPIDEIDKQRLLTLLDQFLSVDFEMDAFDEELIQNQAQQIIYKSIYEKFQSLMENKDKFKDESDRKYLASIQKYQG
ncbi:MAG: hypothetical protein EP335_06730 [Alphaproteobacteria bacterium]|nr:MAG: hypothetical protein EP335_06730 [Alphaproteobacteria bacterium]